jgi:hypothetical protein
MAYKIVHPATTVPDAAVRAGVGLGSALPIAAALYRQLRSADMAQVARSVRLCSRQSDAPGVPPKQAVALLLAAACGARSLGEVDDAQLYLARANTSLPASSGDLHSRLKREEVRLLLDRGELRAAYTLASQLDCLVIDRGSADPIITRDDRSLSLETLLLQAEVAMTVGAVTDAGALLDKACSLAERGGGKEDRYARADQRDQLRLLESLHVCRLGDQHHGLQLLDLLRERIELSGEGNRVIHARACAASGAWQDVDSAPPPGINISEARRYQALVRTASADSPFADPVAPKGDVTLSPAQGARDPISPPIFLPPHMLSEVAAAAASTVAARFGEAIDRIVAQVVSRHGLPDAATSGALYGGRFPHFDLASIIVQAELQRETGVVRVKWDPAHVETTVRSGRLSPLARCGVGFVWMRDGVIVDATLCTEEPPPAESGDERGALEALTCMLQIGIGVGLDHAPSGHAFCYPDERARARVARISAQGLQNPSQNLMHALVVAKETELGIGSSGPDIIGEWEK